MKIIFCLPGQQFSGNFLSCWSEILLSCAYSGIQVMLSQKYSCNIYYVRNMCLGGDVGRGKNQKPFNGKVDYDYIMWLDSDQIFKPAQFQRLILDDEDIVAGMYKMSNGKHFAVCENWDEKFFEENGHFKFLEEVDLKESKLNTKGLMEVSYVGMGFMLVKKGVFESLEYPWFRPEFKKIGGAQDFTMEDVSFCLRAQQEGFKVHVDPSIIVGHEKKLIL